MAVMDSDGLRVKQGALDSHLPSASPLREYLALKDETARSKAPQRGRELVRVREPFDRPVRTMLLMPPMRMFEGAVKRVIPPLGLAYVAASLEAAGMPVEILDCIVEGIEVEERIADGVWRLGLSEGDIRARLRASAPDVVGLSMIYSSDLDNLYRCAQLVKEELPDTLVVVGGLHASIYAKQVLLDGRPYVDVVLRGEGEQRLPAFLADYAAGQLDRAGDGVAGWVAGELVINPQRARLADLDSQPLPAYHLLPMEKYFAHNVPFSPYPRGWRVMQVYTSRGCPIGCTFCASTNFSKAFIARSPQAVVAEIRFYQNRYGIDEIQFADDNLTLHRGRALALFEALAPLGLPWCTPNGIMVNTLDRELVDRMVDSGLYQITLSLDSGNSETLKTRHRKPVDLTRVPDLMAYLQARGVLVHGTLVVGMPGETEEDILEGFTYVEQLPFNSINVFIAQAIPGSELFERAVADGQISYRDALHIDTAKSTLTLSAIAGSRLESLVSDFLVRYNVAMRNRDQDAWDRKYHHHKARMATICIGQASPNTSAVLLAE
jgi:radical SAM superfamily enzyme YgiQ (UPF0313 family)